MSDPHESPSSAEMFTDMLQGAMISGDFDSFEDSDDYSSYDSEDDRDGYEEGDAED